MHQVVQGQRQAAPTTGGIQDLEEFDEHWQEDLLQEGLEEQDNDLLASGVLEVLDAFRTAWLKVLHVLKVPRGACNAHRAKMAAVLRLFVAMTIASAVAVAIVVIVTAAIVARIDQWL